MLLKKYFILLIVLFGFTPCSVKQGVFDVFSLEYHRTVNINKTSQNTYCASTIIDEVVTQKQKKQQLLPSSISYDIPNSSHSILNQRNESDLSGRGPPLYILYQQLKVFPFFTRIS